MLVYPDDAASGERLEILTGRTTASRSPRGSAAARPGRISPARRNRERADMRLGDLLRDVDVYRAAKVAAGSIVARRSAPGACPSTRGCARHSRRSRARARCCFPREGYGAATRIAVAMPEIVRGIGFDLDHTLAIDNRLERVALLRLLELVLVEGGRTCGTLADEIEAVDELLARQRGGEFSIDEAVRRFVADHGIAPADRSR